MTIKSMTQWGMNLPEDAPIIIAGPCSAETEEQTIASCLGAQKAGAHILRAGIWKPRTSPGSFEGIGEEGLVWLRKAKKETGLPTTIEVANAQNVYTALSYGVDILWIGARTTVNPFAVQEIADALKGKDIPILVKNPINPDVKLWVGAIKRLQNAGLTRIAAIHRGFDTLAQKNIYRNPPHWGLVSEFKKHLPDISIINDPSHIAGKRELLYTVAKKALDLNADGWMIESHITPDQAWSDPAQQVTPNELKHLIETLMQKTTASHVSDSGTELKSWRSEIDLVDNALIELLAQRKEIVGNISNFKKKNNLPIVQFERWKEMILNRLQTGKDQGLNEQLVEGIFDAIHQDSVRFQREQQKSAQAENKRQESA